MARSMARRVAYPQAVSSCTKRTCCARRPRQPCSLSASGGHFVSTASSVRGRTRPAPERRRVAGAKRDRGRPGRWRWRTRSHGGWHGPALWRGGAPADLARLWTLRQCCRVLAVAHAVDPRRFRLTRRRRFGFARGLERPARTRSGGGVAAGERGGRLLTLWPRVDDTRSRRRRHLAVARIRAARPG